MSKTKSFNGANVFMSRNLVLPEIFDALLDALNQNAANVFLCCDPSRNGPNDFHIISSPDQEKFEDLKSKGCNLLGPQCVLSCAKENRSLPKQAFTCCLAFDGIKVLASGFDADEKVKIEKMVTAMGGVLLTKTSPDISVVIVKNVLASEYKWALNVLKKPIVSIYWLRHCWIVHRVVPKDVYTILPFSGLTICITGVPADERKQIEKRITQNGGKYSPELTKMCTHLISDVPEGEKYKVARKWGHIHVVTRKWFHQSIERRACLNEESYPVHGNDVSTNKIVRGSSMSQQCSSEEYTENMKPTSVLRGKTFCFSKSFPQVRDGCFLDVGSHILYSPLPYQIPLPGFENLRFCVSQYEEKDRLLLRNLCFVLGAKFVEILNKRVTHLLCKFTNGPKYEAACKWGIPVVTSEWIFECVRKNEVVSLDPFQPKEVTSQDQESGLCTAKALADPFDYEAFREDQKNKRTEAQRGSRITIQRRLPKVNRTFLESIQEQEADENDENNVDAKKKTKKASKRKELAHETVNDPRFSSLFENKDFEIDKDSLKYKALHQVASRTQPSLMEEHFEPVMEIDDRSLSDSDASEGSHTSEDEPDNDKSGTRKRSRIPR